MLNNKKYIFLVLFIYIITAYFSLGHTDPDEYWQIIAVAYYKFDGIKDGLKWEFFSEMRSGLQVFIFYYWLKICYFFKLTNPFTITMLMRQVMGLLSLVTIILSIRVFINKDAVGEVKYLKYLYFLAFLTYFIVLNNVHFSAENFSGKLLLLGISLYFVNNWREKLLPLFISGLILGFAFYARFQIGFAIAGFLLWTIFINKIRFRNIFYIILGLVVAAAINTGIDCWLYGHFTLTWWNYFYQNLVLNKALQYGQDPWYIYILFTLSLIPIGPLFLIAFFVLLCYERKNPLVWVTLPFILAHVLIAHKEGRFLLPIVNFMPIMTLYAILSLEKKALWLKRALLERKWLVKAIIVLNIILLVPIMLTPPATEMLLSQFVYQHIKNPATIYVLSKDNSIQRFYARKNLNVLQVDNPQQIKSGSGSPYYFAITCSDMNKFHYTTETGIIYQNCPSIAHGNQLIKQLFSSVALFNLYDLNKE